MNEPLSTCCGSPPIGEIHSVPPDTVGICSSCHDHCCFEDAEPEEPAPAPPAAPPCPRCRMVHVPLEPCPCIPPPVCPECGLYPPKHFNHCSLRPGNKPAAPPAGGEKDDVKADACSPKRSALHASRGKPVLSLEFEVFEFSEVSMWTHFNHGTPFPVAEAGLKAVQAHLEKFIRDRAMCPFHKSSGNPDAQPRPADRAEGETPRVECKECAGTGIISDQGPGIAPGCREFVTCDCRLKSAPMETDLMRAGRRIAELERENQRLREALKAQDSASEAYGLYVQISDNPRHEHLRSERHLQFLALQDQANDLRAEALAGKEGQDGHA